jgi:hypothetical protein
MDKSQGLFYSAVQKEPEMHPLIELGMSLAPYGLAAYGAVALSGRRVPGSELTQYDMALKSTRNILNRFPMGFLNTFRIAEAGSIMLSGAGMGLDQAPSIGQPGKLARQQVIGSEYITEDTKKYLKGILGEEFAGIEGDIARGNYQFVFEMQEKEVGQGSLYIQETETYKAPTAEGGLELKERLKTGSQPKLVSRNVMGLHLVAGVDTLEIFAHEKPSVTNPFAGGVIQNVDETIDANKIMRSKKTGQQLKMLIAPSISGPLSSLGDLKRRMAVPTAYLSMGVNRFNKVLTATFNQMPIMGRTLEKVMDRTGFSLKTTPGPFYKQYMSLGLKASKIGALYLGLQTVDHYRDKFGLLGNMVASAGVSYAIGKAYEKTTDSFLASTKSRIMGGAFAIQMLLPGFDKGVMEGIATTAANVDIGRSYIGKYTGLSHVRRGIEGIAPGSTEFTTGLFLGVGAAALAYSGYGRRYLERMDSGETHFGDKIFKSVDNLLKSRFGMLEAIPGEGVLIPESPNTLMAKRLGNILYPELIKDVEEKFLKNDFRLLNPFAEEIEKAGFDSPEVKEYKKRLDAVFDGRPPAELGRSDVKKLHTFLSDNESLLKKILGNDYNARDFKAKAVLDFEIEMSGLKRSEIYRTTNVYNEVNESLLRRISKINSRYGGESGVVGNVSRRLEIFGAEIYHSFFGATMKGEINEGLVKELTGESGVKTYDEVAKHLSASPIVRRFGALTLGVTFLHQMMTGAFFGMMEDPDELKATYSGDKLVEVKRGRWWEAGGTPYGGGETSYFRPHAYASLMSKARERSVWGEEVDEYSPLTRFFLKNFTYHLEEKNYYNRPYPMTGAAFEDVPILGKLLSATIGRVVKPTKLMHEDELYRSGPGGEEIAFERLPGMNPEMGELGKGVPKSPYEGMQAAGAIQYTFREIEGLTGYGKNILQKIFTGREILGTRELIFETSNMMDSSVEAYWDKELGGLGFLSEPMRRIFIRPRAEIETYNPIMNTMPLYLPEKFKRGDPYRKIKNGFLRLPGAGYEAVNPDVAGLDPEDYPDIHKYKILADVAPSSRNTISLREKLMERDVGKALTEHESRMLLEINKMHQKRLAPLENDPFHENAIKIPYVSDAISTAYLGATELIRRSMAGAENLIPGGFRPSAKLLGHTRDAIETYEMERVYNTSNSFWDAPVRDWFRPAMYSAANFLGWDGKPMHVQKREDVDAHFDKLQFIKFMRLADSAENARDRKRFLNLAARTRTGVNPEGDALSMYLSLPVAEKKFFDAFAHAQGVDRERILELVPQDQVHLYENVWARIDAGEDISLLTDSKPLIDESYMYSQLAHAEEGMKVGPMPKADWIGWHKDVNINDIKVKYIHSLGEEIHDYDVWGKQVRAVSRKPYLENSELFMYDGLGPSRNSLRNQVIRKSSLNHLDSSRFIFNSDYSPGAKSRGSIIYNDGRESELSNLASHTIRG